MRINTNVASLTANRNLQITQLSVANSMAKLSSGFRINRAGDDAAGLSIANNLRTTTRSLEMASRNIEQANSMLQIAEGAGSSIEKIVERMKELATQASTDTNASQRETLNNEFQDLKSEIDRIASSTEFQGTKLIDGSFSGKTLQIGAGNTSNEQLGVSIGGLTATKLGLASASIDSLASAQAALSQIDGTGTASDTGTTALGEANKVLSKIGAFQNRLGFAQDNVRTSIVNISAAESTIRDVDMAEEMSKFSRNQILQQAGTSMLAQANQVPQGVLSLLR
jgi:flagellin